MGPWVCLARLIFFLTGVTTTLAKSSHLAFQLTHYALPLYDTLLLLHQNQIKRGCSFSGKAMQFDSYWGMDVPSSRGFERSNIVRST